MQFTHPAFAPSAGNYWRASDKELICVAFNPYNNTIVTGGNDCELSIWDLLS
jgi:WD40 repeat protein